jgi:hypothetical protein
LPSSRAVNAAPYWSSAVGVFKCGAWFVFQFDHLTLFVYVPLMALYFVWSTLPPMTTP